MRTAPIIIGTTVVISIGLLVGGGDATQLAWLSAPVAALGFVLNTLTRYQDFEWRKATAARDTMSEIHKHAEASLATALMDCALAGHRYSHSSINGQVEELSLADAAGAIAAGAGASDIQCRIYRWFDWWFYYVDRAGYFWRKGFADFEDFAPTLRPYVTLIAPHDAVFRGMLAAHHYHDALRVIDKLRETSSQSDLGSG